MDFLFWIGHKLNFSRCYSSGSRILLSIIFITTGTISKGITIFKIVEFSTIDVEVFCSWSYNTYYIREIWISSCPTNICWIYGTYD